MENRVVEIDLEDLKREVKDFLLSLQRDRLTPAPIQRIGLIIERLRQYKLAIVRANVPRGFDRYSWSQQQKHHALRLHREGQLAQSDSEGSLTWLKEWLQDLDSAFVLAGELFWRLNDTDWETEVWTPIYDWVEKGFTMLFKDSHPIAPVDPDALAAWESHEQDLEYRLFARMRTFVPEKDWPIIDETSPFTIRWQGFSCYIGDNESFKIMKRLIEARGRLVSRESIGIAINSPGISDDAMRQAATRLRKRLRDGGLSDLAQKIKTTDNGQVMYIDMEDRTS